jgi:DNA-binding response OmpR family regulator
MALPARILIVDDEQPIADLLSHTFEQEGHVVARAHDGIDCMNKMAGFRPDVVIMDIMMPRLDGVEATQLIRRNRAYQGTVIVALTAKADADTRRRMHQAGADAFVRKPFVIARLVERVGNLLATRLGMQ